MAHSPIDESAVSPKDLLSLEGEVLGGYRLETLLGTGGMAWVYQTSHSRLGGKAAVKIMFPQWSQKPEMRKRFMQEAQIQYQLNHPHIVRVLDLIEEQGVVGFVMEWCDGGDLAQLLEKKPGGILPLDELGGIFLPLLDAIGVAHDQGVIHRDLKPGNVLLSHQNGTLVPKVTDFGIAKMTTQTGLTATGTVVGTMHYTSPEQLKESKHVDVRADIYSIGAMLYQAVSGHLPFEGKMPGILLKIFEHPPPPLPESVPTELVGVIMRCLAKDPDARFANCKELELALNLCLTSEPPTLKSNEIPAMSRGEVARVTSNANSPTGELSGDTIEFDDTTPFAVPSGEHLRAASQVVSAHKRPIRWKLWFWGGLGWLLLAALVTAILMVEDLPPDADGAPVEASRDAGTPTQRIVPDVAVAPEPRALPEPSSAPPTPDATRPAPRRTEPRIRWQRTRPPARRAPSCKGGDVKICLKEGTAALNSGKPSAYRRAFSMLQRACRLRSAVGCRELALLHRMGWGTRKQPRRALQLFVQACRMKEKDACLWAATMFKKGEGTKRSCRSANAYFRVACKLGNGSACKQRCQDAPPPRRRRVLRWEKRANAAQYKKGIGGNLISRFRDGSVAQCKQICARNRRCAFFFYNARGLLYLPPHNFAYRECVFFSGKPWVGSAPASDMYIKRFR